jgi:hypothetical protein
MKWRLPIAIGVVVAAAVAVTLWVLDRRVVDHWLAVHTGTNDVSGVYYGFWSGFGSDLAEFGIIGALGTAVYQVVKKFNCHEPGCWRVGTHPAAAGQFLLCYRHHPDFQGHRPTHDLIVRLHREDLERRDAIRERLHEIHEHIVTHLGEEAAVGSDPGAAPRNGPGGAATL